MYSCTGCQNANNEDKAHLHLSPVVVIFFLYADVFFKCVKIRSSVIYFHIRNPFKKFIQSGSLAAWWLSVVRGGLSVSACYMGSNGDARDALATSASVRVPLCFRIAVSYSKFGIRLFGQNSKLSFTFRIANFNDTIDKFYQIIGIELIFALC